MHMRIESMRDEYAAVLRRVRDAGLERSPRGIPTIDAGYTTITIENAALPQLPLHTGRNLSTAIAAVEALQLIAGETKPELLLRVAPQFASYMEAERPGIPAHFHGAYGVRVGTQLASVVDKLRADPDTRQAVVTLWDPRLDNTAGKSDYPCTVALGFALHEGMLDMHVLMRSNDAWLGLPYDVFVFNQTQWTIAHALGAIPGRYVHTAWSLHLYERDIERVDDVGYPRTIEYQPRGIAASDIAVSRRIAGDLMMTRELPPGQLMSSAERWYTDALASVVG